MHTLPDSVALIADIDNVQCCNPGCNRLYYEMDTSESLSLNFFLPGIEFPQTFEAVLILGWNLIPP